MKQSVTVRKFNSEEQCVVEVEDGDCPACLAAQHVRWEGESGDFVFFELPGGQIQKVILIERVGGQAAVMCVEVSRQQAETEIKEWLASGEAN